MSDDESLVTDGDDYEEVDLVEGDEMLEYRLGNERLDTTSGLPGINAEKLREVIRGQARLCEMQIWDQMPYEGQKQYSYFCMFRDLGINRTLQKLVNPGASPQTLKVWAYRFQWTYRLDTHDAWKLQHQAEDLDKIRQEIIVQKHNNLRRLDEINGQMMDKPLESMHEAEIAQSLEVTKVSNDTHRTIFGEKKQIIKRTQIDINLSDQFSDLDV